MNSPLKWIISKVLKETSQQQKDAGFLNFSIENYEKKLLLLFENDNKNPEVFVNPQEILTTMEFIIDMVEEIKTNSLTNIKEDLLIISEKIRKLIYPDKENIGKLFRSLLLFIYGEYEQIDPILISFFKINTNQFEILKEIIQNFTHLLKAPKDFITSHSNSLLKSYSDKKSTVLKKINDKLAFDEKLSIQDLFRSFDIDQSGKIDLEEFKTLTRRLGMDLSEHRIIEIFTSVKINLSSEEMQLDEKEFEVALGYLQNKSLYLILDYLGISKELLMWILVWLCLILLVIFAFIFVGIAAFALGGTFGAVINSIFPIG